MRKQQIAPRLTPGPPTLGNRPLSVGHAIQRDVKASVLLCRGHVTPAAAIGRQTPGANE